MSLYLLGLEAGMSELQMGNTAHKDLEGLPGDVGRAVVTATALARSSRLDLRKCISRAAYVDPFLRL